MPDTAPHDQDIDEIPQEWEWLACDDEPSPTAKRPPNHEPFLTHQLAQLWQGVLRVFGGSPDTGDQDLPITMSPIPFTRIQDESPLISASGSSNVSSWFDELEPMTPPPSPELEAVWMYRRGQVTEMNEQHSFLLERQLQLQGRLEGRDHQT